METQEIQNTQRKIINSKGSVLIWAMVALLVITLLTALVLVISTRMVTSSKERQLDSQAYHSAYSLTRSITAWIKSYDPNIPPTDTTNYPAEKEKADFIDALRKSGTVTVKADQIAAEPSLPEKMGECEALLTYKTEPDDPSVATIDIESTAVFEGREVSVNSTLESSYRSSRPDRDVRFDSTFSPAQFGLSVNVVTEINGVTGSWPQMAANPAHAAMVAIDKPPRNRQSHLSAAL